MDILGSIPRQYWHDPEWLGLAQDIDQPTYFHLLGLTSDATDEKQIRAGGREAETRLRAHVANVHNAAGRQVANDLLGVLAKARLELSDPKKRQTYTEALWKNFLSYAQQYLEDNLQDQSGPEAARNAAQELRGDLLQRAESHYGLCAKHATSAVDQAIQALVKGGAPQIKDPASPTFFEFLEVSEDLSDKELSLLQQNRDRLHADFTAKARRSNIPKTKEENIGKAKQVEQAFEVLADRHRREEYRKEIQKKRLDALEAEINRRIAARTTLIPGRAYNDLLGYAQSIRLTQEDLNEALEILGKDYPGGRPNRLGPLPTVRDVVLGEQPSQNFSFVLTNAGNKKIRVELFPGQQQLTFSQTKYTIEGDGQVTVNGTVLNRGLPEGQHKLCVEVKAQGGGSVPGGGPVAVYVRVLERAKPKLRAINAISLGARPVGSVMHHQMTVANDGTGDLEATLSASPWIKLSTSRVHVAGGQSVNVTMEVQCQIRGSVRGQVQIQSPFGSQTVLVELSGREPKEGTLVLKSTQVDLGTIEPGEKKTFTIEVSNNGDLPLEADVVFAEESLLNCAAPHFRLEGGAKEALQFTLRAAGTASDRSTWIEVINFQPLRGNPPAPVQVNYVIHEKPGVVDRYGLGIGVVASVMLVPAWIGLLIPEPGWLRRGFMFAGWSLWPVGVLLARYFWTQRLQDVSKTLGGVMATFILLLIAIPGDYIVGGLARGFLGIFMGEGAAASVTGAILGFIGGAMVFVGGAAAIDDKDEELMSVGICCAIGAAIACAIGGGYNAMDARGERLFCVGVAVLAGIGTASGLKSNKQTRITAKKAQGISWGTILLATVLFSLCFVASSNPPTPRAATADSSPLRPPATDLSGSWNGSLTHGMTRYEFAMALTQDQGKVRGTSTIKRSNREFAEMELSGTFQGSQFEFQDVRIQRRQGAAINWVLKKGSLKWGQGNREELRGTWNSSTYNGGDLWLTKGASAVTTDVVPGIKKNLEIQKTDLTGYWKGNLEYGGENCEFWLDLNHNNYQISGNSTLISPGGRAGKMELKGTMRNNQLQFEETRIVNEKGSAASPLRLKGGTLRWTSDVPDQLQGNLGTYGPVTLAKTDTPPPPITVENDKGGSPLPAGLNLSGRWGGSMNGPSGNSYPYAMSLTSQPRFRGQASSRSWKGTSTLTHGGLTYVADVTIEIEGAQINFQDSGMRQLRQPAPPRGGVRSPRFVAPNYPENTVLMLKRGTMTCSEETPPTLEGNWKVSFPVAEGTFKLTKLDGSFVPPAEAVQGQVKEVLPNGRCMVTLGSRHGMKSGLLLITGSKNVVLRVDSVYGLYQCAAVRDNPGDPLPDVNETVKIKEP